MTSVSASRVTRSRNSLRLALLAFAGVLAAVTVLRAQETSPAPAQQGSPAPATKAPAPAEKPGTAADAEASRASPPVPSGPSPARFEPTEKVRADFDVSFPIDI
jgi:hypothetical protein